MQSNFHFYVVFNPLIRPVNEYPTQAHEFYHRLKSSMGTMWWGKMKMSRNIPELDIHQFEEVLKNNKAQGSETVLFISDFTNLWVARVEAVTSSLPKKAETLSIYDGEEVEIWFQISDMDLISSEANSTRLKIAEFASGPEFGPEVKSFTPQTGAIRFPVIIEDHSVGQYFMQYKNKKRMVSENPMIIKSMEGWERREKVTYTIPQPNFQKLPSLVQKQVIWAETIFPQDLGKSAISYLRILEGLLNATLVREIHARVSNEGDYLSLESLHEVLNSCQYNGRNVDEILSHTTQQKFWEFCKFDLRNFLHRNIDTKKVCSVGAEDHLRPEEALFIRNSMLGVGCKGIINEVIERYCDLSKLTDEHLKAG